MRAAGCGRATIFFGPIGCGPALVPVEESCAEARRLHQELLEQPRLALATARRDNDRAVPRIRDRLLAKATVEAACLDLVRAGILSLCWSS
jgi:hypothetical protein